MINFIKIAKELYAQVNISNRDIFYSEYKLRLKDNPEDLTNFPITQDNLNKYLPFLKEEEIYYLHAIAHKFTVNDIKDEIEEHNRNYGTNFSINNFKEIYSKNLNLLMNYIDNLKSKNGAIIYIDRSVFAIYYLLNLSLAKILSFQGKEISKDTKENLPEKYKEKIKIYAFVKDFIITFIKQNENSFNMNKNIIDLIKQNAPKKLKELKKYINDNPNSLDMEKSTALYVIDTILKKINKLNSYFSIHSDREFSTAKMFLDRNTKSVFDENEIIKNTLNNIFDELYKFNHCDDIDDFFYKLNINNIINKPFDGDTAALIREIYINAGDRFLISDSDKYIKIISEFIIKNN